MSTQADGIAEIISQLEQTVELSYCQVSTMALLVYYNLVTLEEEVQYLSRRQWTGSAVLFMLNRYLPLVFAVYGNPFYSFSTNLTSCEAQQIFSILLESLQYLPWAAFSALRTYALQKNRPCAFFIFMFSLSPLIINLLAKHWQIVYEDPIEGCVITNTIPINLERTFAILARLPLVIADIAIIVITWTTQYTSHKLATTLRGNLNLATVLLRDGTVYFLTLTAINIAQMITGVLSVFSKNVGLLPSFLVTFAEPITAILVSSFLTDLRKAADSSTHQHSLTSLGTIEFRVIGSLGASLAAPGVEGLDTEDEGTEETTWSPTEGASETAQSSSPESVELREVC